MNKLLFQLSMMMTFVVSINSISFGMDKQLVSADPCKVQMGLDYGVDSAFLPKELLITIGACDDEARDDLQKTCKFMKQKLSIKGPFVADLVANSLFCTKKKNITFMALDAAWDRNIKGLTALMPKMEQPHYKYQYKLPEGWNSSLDLVNIVKTRMTPDEREQVEAMALKHGCKLGFYLTVGLCDDLKIACYRRDPQSVEKALSNSGINGDINGVGHELCIAIDRNSPECIKELLSHIENCYVQDRLYYIDYHVGNLNCTTNSATSFVGNGKMYQDILEVAMQSKKKKAFEALIENDTFRCLNFVYSTSDGRKLSVLDWILEYEGLQHGGEKTYSDIYIKHGGKTCAELNANEICTIQ